MKLTINFESGPTGEWIATLPHLPKVRGIGRSIGEAASSLMEYLLVIAIETATHQNGAPDEPAAD
jgi:hypothetical protein